MPAAATRSNSPSPSGSSTSTTSTSGGAFRTARMRCPPLCFGHTGPAGCRFDTSCFLHTYCLDVSLGARIGRVRLCYPSKTASRPLPDSGIDRSRGPEHVAKQTPQEAAAAVERTAGLVNEERLGLWMDEQGLPGKGEPVSVSLISGGASNEIFRIGRGEFEAVLRRPPRIVPKGRNETMVREYRVLEALN